MDKTKQQEAKLLEAAAAGDLDSVEELSGDVNVNAQHAMNGWSALHWAAKRNHQKIVSFLLEKGADASLVTSRGERAVDLATDPATCALLGGEANGEVKDSGLAFTPNYLANPEFPYVKPKEQPLKQTNLSKEQVLNNLNQPPHTTTKVQRSISGRPQVDDELVLKVRVANAQDTDYIEIELEWDSLTYEQLVEVACQELRVDPSRLIKIRKLPNTIVRKDKDIRRLQQLQELELVMMRDNALSAGSIHKTPQPRHIDIVY